MHPYLFETPPERKKWLNGIEQFNKVFFDRDPEGNKQEAFEILKKCTFTIVSMFCGRKPCKLDRVKIHDGNLTMYYDMALDGYASSLIKEGTLTDQSLETTAHSLLVVSSFDEEDFILKVANTASTYHRESMISHSPNGEIEDRTLKYNGDADYYFHIPTIHKKLLSLFEMDDAQIDEFAKDPWFNKLLVSEHLSSADSYYWGLASNTFRFGHGSPYLYPDRVLENIRHIKD